MCTRAFVIDVVHYVCMDACMCVYLFSLNVINLCMQKQQPYVCTYIHITHGHMHRYIQILSHFPLFSPSLCLSLSLSLSLTHTQTLSVSTHVYIHTYHMNAHKHHESVTTSHRYPHMHTRKKSTCQSSNLKADATSEYCTWPTASKQTSYYVYIPRINSI